MGTGIPRLTTDQVKQVQPQHERGNARKSDGQERIASSIPECEWIRYPAGDQSYALYLRYVDTAIAVANGKGEGTWVAIVSALQRQRSGLLNRCQAMQIAESLWTQAAFKCADSPGMRIVDTPKLRCVRNGP